MVALLTVVSVLFVASQATALASRANILSGLLAARQTSTVDPSSFPTQCQSGCTSALDAISSCTDMTCICSTSNVNSLQTCINCIVSTDPTADVVSEGQSVLTTFNNECAGQGASLTIGSSGGTATGSSAASSSSGKSSGQKAAAGRVGISLTGFVGAGVLAGLVALL